MLDKDMRARLEGLAVGPIHILAPWPAVDLPDSMPVGSPAPADAPWTWLYSGNLGRAHEWQTLLDAQQLLEARGRPIRLVFQGDGAARSAAQAYADQLHLRQCIWTGYVPEAKLVPALLAAHLLIVTQRPETRGLLWPSKLALIELLPCPIIYVGCADGAISRRLAARGNAGIFSPGQAEAVANWVESWFSGPAKWLAVPAFPNTSRQEGCSLLEQWLRDSTGDGSSAAG